MAGSVVVTQLAQECSVSARQTLKHSSAHQTETAQLEACLHLRVVLNNKANSTTFRSVSVRVWTSCTAVAKYLGVLRRSNREKKWVTEIGRARNTLHYYNNWNKCYTPI